MKAFIIFLALAALFSCSKDKNPVSPALPDPEQVLHYGEKVLKTSIVSDSAHKPWFCHYYDSTGYPIFSIVLDSTQGMAGDTIDSVSIYAVSSYYWVMKNWRYADSFCISCAYSACQNDTAGGFYYYYSNDRLSKSLLYYNDPDTALMGKWETLYEYDIYGTIASTTVTRTKPPSTTILFREVHYFQNTYW